MQFQSDRMDNLINVQFPQVIEHFNKSLEALTFQCLDVDTHRRKWNLMIYGMDGTEAESANVTRQKCMMMAREKLKVANPESHQLQACHRLNKKAKSPIIIRFVDISHRDEWLGGARNLKNCTDQILISQDLPPTLRPLKKDVLNQRRQLDASLKPQAKLLHIAKWPYVKVEVPGKPAIYPKIMKSDIIKSVTGLEPLVFEENVFLDCSEVEQT